MANKALLIGINNYKYINDLRGCINDITNMRDILINQYKFQPENISLLADHRATKEMILTRVKWLFSNLSAKDHIVFHFSGHGSQIRENLQDEEHRDEKDELDELICLYDIDFKDNSGYLVDDELSELFYKKPAQARLTVLLDCCHSGSGTRDILGVMPPASDLRSPGWGAGGPKAHPLTRVAQARMMGEEVEAGPEVICRFAPPPIDIIARVDERKTMPTRHLLRTNGKKTMNHTLLAACTDFQTSADALIGGTYNGAFTYYFCDALRDLGPKVTYEQIVGRVRHSLKHYHYGQIPQLEGSKKGQFLFS